MTRFCQTVLPKAICIILVAFWHSCSTPPPPVPAVKAKPVWFQAPNRFVFLTKELKTPVHPFFDLVPFSSNKDLSLNYFLVTPRDSEYRYNLELVSGKIYKEAKFCEQEDVWKSYGKDLEGPPYAEGMVPRLLDGLGGPQRMIIFGDKKYFRPFEYSVDFSRRARVIGGVVLQYCESYPCASRDAWLSRLVLVAVHPDDPDLEKIKNLEDFKKANDWERIKAYLENSYGVTLVNNERLPAYRLVGQIPPTKALEYAREKGHLFSFSQLKTLRRSCHKLYDFIWKHAKYYYHKREKIVGQKTKVIDIDSGKKGPRGYSSFTSLFRDLHGKHRAKLTTCMKFVRASNIRLDPQRHWFFAFIDAYMKLENLGYVYSCAREAWLYNAPLSSGERSYSPEKLLSRCPGQKLDRAFETAITTLTGLWRGNQESYRYIEYDERPGGTHQRIFAWAFDNGKKIVCEGLERELKVTTFPPDVTWKKTNTQQGVFGEF